METRYATYTRKSTTEGLDSDFNTLDAQRQAAEHYTKSQAAAGWVVLESRHDDGGFTGGDIDRAAPARSWTCCSSRPTSGRGSSSG